MWKNGKIIKETRQLRNKVPNSYSGGHEIESGLAKYVSVSGLYLVQSVKVVGRARTLNIYFSYVETESKCFFVQ